MTGHEIRELFLSFFEKKGHTRVKSAIKREKFSKGRLIDLMSALNIRFKRLVMTTSKPKVSTSMVKGS